MCGAGGLPCSVFWGVLYLDAEGYDWGLVFSHVCFLTF